MKIRKSTNKAKWLSHSPHQSVASALFLPLQLLLLLLRLLRPLSASVRGICTAATAAATAAAAATTGATALPDVGRHIGRRLRVRDVVTGLGLCVCLRRGDGIEGVCGGDMRGEMEGVRWSRDAEAESMAMG
jgi:hypothetical protein